MRSLPVIGRAGTNMRIRGSSIVSCVFIHAAIHVTIIKAYIQESGATVEVLLNISRGRRGAAALISQRILIGILRRITPQQPIHTQSPVTGVLIPPTIIRPTTSHQLKDLVRSGLRPTRARQRNLTRHNRSRKRRTLHILHTTGVVVTSLYRTTHTRGDDSWTPRGITRQLTIRPDRRHTHSPRPAAVGTIVLFPRIVTHSRNDDDTLRHRPSNRPLILIILVGYGRRNRDNLSSIVDRGLDQTCHAIACV